MLLASEKTSQGKEILETALEKFEKLGADLWRDKCIEDLEKINYSNP